MLLEEHPAQHDHAVAYILLPVADFLSFILSYSLRNYLQQTFPTLEFVAVYEAPFPCKYSQSALHLRAHAATYNKTSPSFISQIRRFTPTATPSILILFPSSFPIHHFCNRNSHYALAQIALVSYFGPGRPPDEGILKHACVSGPLPPFSVKALIETNSTAEFMLQYPAVHAFVSSPRCRCSKRQWVCLDWTESQVSLRFGRLLVSGLTSPVFEMLPSCR